MFISFKTIVFEYSLFQALDGVVAFINANDIPGRNDFMISRVEDPVFSFGRSEFAGQPVGLIVAIDRETAIKAAKLVELTYSNQGEVITDIRKAMANPENVQADDPTSFGDVNAGFASSASVVSGSYSMLGQYHFTMETQVCIARPSEDGIDIDSATQWISKVKDCVAQVLGIPVNR